MRSRVRSIGVGLLAALLGVGAAVALAGRDDGVRACANKRSGEISVVGKNGRCGSAAVSITISGEAFKSTKGGTLTINGVAFKAGAPRTGTLPNSLTINGNSFRTGRLPNSLTINGTSFSGGWGRTLTINGVAATGGPGPAGPAGPAGPTGASGSLAGSAPAEVAGPVNAEGGATTTLVSQAITTDGTGRLLVAGGANLTCNPCPEAVTVALTRDGAASPAVTRTLGRGNASFSLNELLMTPGACNPCRYSLALVVAGGGAGAPNPVVSASDIRLGLVDLGPVARR